MLPIPKDLVALQVCAGDSNKTKQKTGTDHCQTSEKVEVAVDVEVGMPLDDKDQ
jgi:hypothetical protein